MLQLFWQLKPNIFSKSIYFLCEPVRTDTCILPLENVHLSEGKFHINQLMHSEQMTDNISVPKKTLIHNHIEYV